MPETSIRPWSDADLPLLHVANRPEMTTHLGGPESDAEVGKRHRRYLDYWENGGARMFAVVADGSPVGGIGWWPTTWRQRELYETGWFVIPDAQGKGIAQDAVRLIIRDAVEHGILDSLAAFPASQNAGSNALCRNAGFTLEGTEDFPFRGVTLTVNAWVRDLAARR